MKCMFSDLHKSFKKSLMVYNIFLALLKLGMLIPSF